jgi:3-hydroxyisobutyrate dehydrogenase-like beta-hydroxyacid dehydrogenase
MNIGFIGIGQMGRRMAGRLLESGYGLTVYDVVKDVARDLLDKGAKWIGTPKAMAESCSVVISMVPGPLEVEEVVYGASGLMAGWKKDDIYIDMSTSSPTTTRRVARDAKSKGVSVLDAPVSGGIAGAGTGTLTIMVGGNSSTLERVHEILERLGEKIVHVGEVGCGNIAKIVNSLIAISCHTINAEGFVLGVKAGINARKLWEVITDSSGNNWTLQEAWPRTVLRGNFEAGFKLSLALKDMDLALALGREYGIPLPTGAAVEQCLLEAKASGLDEKAFQATILRLEEITGVQVRIHDR